MSRIWLNSNALASSSKSAFSSPHPPARSQPAYRRCQSPKPGPTARRGQPGPPPAPRPGSGSQASLAVPSSAPAQPSAFINARQTRKRHLTALKLFRLFSACFVLFRRVLHRKTSVVMAEATRRRAQEGREPRPSGPPGALLAPALWGSGVRTRGAGVRHPRGAAEGRGSPLPTSAPAGKGARAGQRGWGLPSLLSLL